MEDIKKGDWVEYIDVKLNKKTRKSIKVPKRGIWDGEKVVCTQVILENSKKIVDSEKTIIRNKKWLKKV